MKSISKIPISEPKNSKSYLIKTIVWDTIFKQNIKINLIVLFLYLLIHFFPNIYLSLYNLKEVNYSIIDTLKGVLISIFTSLNIVEGNLKYNDQKEWISLRENLISSQNKNLIELQINIMFNDFYLTTSYKQEYLDIDLKFFDMDTNTKKKVNLEYYCNTDLKKITEYITLFEKISCEKNKKINYEALAIFTKKILSLKSKYYLMYQLISNNSVCLKERISLNKILTQFSEIEATFCRNSKLEENYQANNLLKCEMDFIESILEFKIH